ncbi:PRC-barrel domain-containing protein [Fulvimarina sp. 2208YS6-2-32]|uniref:PRC-barrel domain-containing protein n=1 Tax=Fulvimarina uroteuthidis TaxID=3098149 RepID=A0ABU5I2Y5_9HYPH|nr:PRC-barrel domain-containing protein [Fulvimarina sp. 2208YS6-2-32]MDY8109700.1 PRC-barrel domain-containing protein [Fulvimarina sp. 2208YS6-2-32]
MLKRTGTAIAAALLFGGTALAQSEQYVEVNDSVMVAPFNLAVDDVDDRNVYDASGTEVGEVSEVLGSDDQTPTHLEVDFEDDDSSTYPDRDDVIVPIADFSFTNDQIVINLTPEDVTALPTRN